MGRCAAIACVCVCSPVLGELYLCSPNYSNPFLISQGRKESETQVARTPQAPCLSQNNDVLIGLWFSGCEVYCGPV